MTVHISTYSLKPFSFFAPYRLAMELTVFPKGFRTNDNKLTHHHFPDVLATVYTTQEIPKETVLGPCLLQDTQLDTVAFIALKCSERRNIHYTIKVRGYWNSLLDSCTKIVVTLKYRPGDLFD